MNVPSVPSPDICRRIEHMARIDKDTEMLGPWSTGEKLAVCVVLNRHDWLTAMGYTILEALARLNSGGEDWVGACQLVRAMWHDDDEPEKAAPQQLDLDGNILDGT
jgi:hypothetical protein